MSGFAEMADRQQVRLFRFFGLIVAATAVLSVFFEQYLLFVFPFSLLVFGIIFHDFRRLFYLLFAVLPFSIEYYFEGAGLGTDIPSEPIMILLTGIGLAAGLQRKFALPLVYWKNPITLLLFLHVFWIGVAAIHSTYPMISFKFLAAKIWYIIPFFVLPLFIARDASDFEKAYRVLYVFLYVSITIVLIRHAFEGFTFAASYEVVRPFFRNHVNYAAISVVCLPFVWAFYRINRLEAKTNLWMGIVLVTFIIGIYFSFTRAAILSMLIALVAGYIITKKWVKHALAISVFAGTVLVVLLSFNNRFMDFTPEFERTITHTEFDNLLEATYKLEDISSMERVYRWMAGIEMIRNQFWLGFGPGTFYSNYKSYSISSFQTYVSANPEKSGIHNYFLMTWVEQGLIGFLIFLAICLYLLVEGERLYHQCTQNRDKLLIMATTLSLIIIFAMCLINDLIETDKVGPFFFLNAAILVYYSSKYGNPVVGSSSQNTNTRQS
jgi:O-antigen ligase